MRQLGKRIESSGKQGLEALVRRCVGDREQLRLADVEGVRKTVIVRPNFRIGNTVISTGLIDAVRERFAGSDGQLDFVAADSTAALLNHFPLGRVYTITRGNPLTWLAAIRSLRREAYDLAVDGGRGSFTSALLTWLTGARYRAGSGNWVGSFLNVDVGNTTARHFYEKEAEFGRVFSPTADGCPRLILTEQERDDARRLLWSRPGGEDVSPPRFIALFIGGHLDKRWPGDRWIELVRELSSTGVQVVVFTGPEELALCAKIERLQLDHVKVVPVEPLRVLAAACADASLVVTPDTGPMHLAAAVGVPVVAVLQARISSRYVPLGEQHRELMRPTVSELLETIAGHPAWPG